MAEVLASLFGVDGDEAPAPGAEHSRADASYTALCQRFRVSRPTFRQQFNQMYVSRIAKLRPRALDAARTRWNARAEGKSGEGPRIADKIVRLRVGQERVIVGTVCKDMPARPSVVEEFAGAYTSKTLATRVVVSSPEDTLALEDETGRVELVRAKGAPYVSLPSGSIVTGVVMAVRGVVLADGSVQVHGFCFPDLAPPSPLPRLALASGPSSSASEPSSSSSSSSPGGTFDAGAVVLLVSDLGYGSPVRETARQLLWEFVTGTMGGTALGAAGSRVCRVVVAGGLTAERPVAMNSKFLSPEEQELLAQPVLEADAALASVAPSVPVDVMPGRHDPGSALMPQQPFHGVLLPLSQRYRRFNRAPNPHHFRVGGVDFLGHSGQPLDAMLSNAEAEVLDVDPDAEERGAAAAAVPAAASSSSSTAEAEEAEDDAGAPGREFSDTLPSSAEPRLRAMCNCLRWQHLAPNTPDGLSCYPFLTDDPFVIEEGETPHVLFAGGQPAFGTRVVGAGSGSTRVVLVPSFAQTGQVVLLDLATLAATTMTFASPVDDDGEGKPGLLAGYDGKARARAKAVAGVKLRKTPTTASRRKPMGAAAAAAASSSSASAAAAGAEGEEEEEAAPPAQDDDDEDEDDDGEGFVGEGDE